MELSQKRLQQALAPRAIRYYESVASTNDLAKAWLIEGASTGSVVIADEQRKGRGRKGRIWYTPSNVALAVSLILHPKLEYVHQISMLGGIVVAELAAYLHIPDVGIKWANDVQLAGKKVSGILPEAVWDDNQLRGVVLGMGVNVRNDFRGTDVEHTATTLESATNESLNRIELLNYLLSRVDVWSAQIGSKALFEAWKGRLTTLGQRVEIEGIVGEAVDVMTNGALLVKQDDGTMQHLFAGDVSLTGVAKDTDGNPTGLGD